MKVCFIGIGSMAQRHIRNLVDICKKRKRDLVIDVYRSGIGKSIDDSIIPYVNREYRDYYTLPKDYDVIFITNPTHYHLETLKRFYDNAKAFFIEKPIVAYEQIEEFEKSRDILKKIIYVACPLRYKAVIQYIKENVDHLHIYSVRAISSSYLPDWRPQVDYRNVYSAKKELGGGVAIDLIHEWDYLNYIFGKPDKNVCMMDKFSHLEIDSEDIAIYLAKYSNMFVELHLDYFGKVPIRQLQLFTKEDTIICDLIKNEVTYLNSGKKISFKEERDDFQKKELNCFLDIIDGKAYNLNDAGVAIETLRLTALSQVT